MLTHIGFDSIWWFLLLGMEAIRTYKTNPHLTIGTYQIPTWATPLILVVVVTALVPNTSFLGHLCGLGVGYICKCPSSLLASQKTTDMKGLRRTGLSQVPITAREDLALVGGQAEAAAEVAALCQCRSENVWTIRGAAKLE